MRIPNVRSLRTSVLAEEVIFRRMVLVCGTSTCHMAVSQNKLFIPGVWGPFWSGTSLASYMHLVNISSLSAFFLVPLLLVLIFESTLYLV